MHQEKYIPVGFFALAGLFAFLILGGTFYPRLFHEDSVYENATVLLYGAALVYYVVQDKIRLGAFPVMMLLVIINKEAFFLKRFFYALDGAEFYRTATVLSHTVLFLIAAALIVKQRHQLLHYWQTLMAHPNRNALLTLGAGLVAMAVISQMIDFTNRTVFFFFLLEEVMEIFVPIFLIWGMYLAIASFTQDQR